MLAAASCVQAQANSSEGEWVSLFNGKNLDGWTVKCLPQDRDNSFWQVIDGTILCDSVGHKDHDYIWLMTDAEYGDFELRLKIQAYRDSTGNSGVQVRSRYDSSPDAPRGGWLDGPQVDVHPPGSWRTGLIYDETREERRWLSPSLKDWNIKESQGPAEWKFEYTDGQDVWNDLHILCQGTRIKTTLNGLVMTDFDGSGILNDEAHRAHNVGMSGHIALQLHANSQLRIRFKDIMLRKLSGK